MVLNSLIKKTLKLSSLSLFANILGFLIPIYIAYVFKISKQTDNFFFSYGIITFGGIVFTGAIRSVIVPFLIERLKDNELFNVFVSTIFYYSVVSILVLSAIFFIIFFGVYYFLHKELFFYLAISVPIFFFTIQNALFYGVLNSKNLFYLAEMSPLSRAVIIYATIFFFQSSIGILSIILGYTLGEFAKFIHLLYVVKIREKVNLSFKIRQFSEIRGFLKGCTYQILSTAISSASPLIDKVVASFLIVGSISMLDYGDKLFMVFTVILNSFLVIILSKWSNDVINKKFDLKKMNTIIYIIMGITSVIVVVIYFLKGHIVGILYPKIPKDRQIIIAMILLLNVIGFIFYASSQIINRATIAFKATGILVKTAIVKSIVNVTLDVLFVLKFGIIGITVSTIFVNLIGFMINYWLFIRQSKTFGLSSSVA